MKHATIGIYIQAARAERGWAQHQLAEAAGISRSTVSSAEVGAHSTTLATIEAIAGAFQVTIEDLFCTRRPPAANVGDPNHSYDQSPCACLAQTYNLTYQEAHALHRFLTHLSKRSI